MADTIRSLSELNALLADNTQEDISPQDLRDLMISQMVHGEIGSTGAATIILPSGWNTVVLNSAGSIQRGVILDIVNYRITDIPVVLKAIITCEVVFTGSLNEDYEFTVWKNVGTVPEQIVRMNRTFRVLNIAQTLSHTWSTAVQFAAGDTIEMGVRSGTGSNEFTVKFAGLRLQRIGVE